MFFNLVILFLHSSLSIKNNKKNTIKKKYNPNQQKKRRRTPDWELSILLFQHIGRDPKILYACVLDLAFDHLLPFFHLGSVNANGLEIVLQDLLSISMNPFKADIVMAVATDVDSFGVVHGFSITDDRIVNVDAKAIFIYDGTNGVVHHYAIAMMNQQGYEATSELLQIRFLDCLGVADSPNAVGSSVVEVII